MAVCATRLAFFDDMRRLEADDATVVCYLVEDGGRHAIILDSTIFHPQGGGQPADTGCIAFPGNPGFKFVVEDVRSKENGVVYHYGAFEDAQTERDLKREKGQRVHLCVDAHRRNLNSRLHSAGHLLDICMRNIGLSYLEPGKGYHFPDGPFVEYKGTIPADQLLNKQNELEMEADALISTGGKVLAAAVPYEEASELCGGILPSYILKDLKTMRTIGSGLEDWALYHLTPRSSKAFQSTSNSIPTGAMKGTTPRIVRLGNNPGCPCGGTHVVDIADIKSVKVSQIRVKKGYTKVFYTVGS